ncbi:glycosyltransferase family 4 protein [Polluticoccus soli]|uniref:glycosyltransferase family 4 protein n=1 Tax=Polluticoccus soli TaxID=3034150 RepID=UPI0023E1073B|nr:glycosyltransferase family 4 protein [Flavipsychrobacter sp. JY13-12]
MNILYICDEYPPGRHGGIGTAVQLLARQMAKLGHNVVVAGYYDWGYEGLNEFTDNGVKVYRFRRKLSSGLFSKPNALTTRVAYRFLKSSGVFQWDINISLKRYHHFLENIIAKHKIDIAEVPDYHDYMRFCTTYTPFPALSVPTVVRLHGSITYFSREAGIQPPAYVRQMERELLLQASGVFSVSRYTAQKTAEYLEVGKNIDVIYNGIDTRTAINAEKVPGRVIFTGSLAHKKGIYQLMQAWNTVYKQVPGAVLEIYGKGPVKKIKRFLTRDAKNSVRFNGHVSRSDLMTALAQANVAVFPSFAETFGLAALEAMACGTAVIFTNRTSGPEVVEDGKDGLLVDPANIVDIANKLCLLLKNKELCTQLAENGRQKAQEKFDIVHIANQHLAYYNRFVTV